MCYDGYWMDTETRNLRQLYGHEKSETRDIVQPSDLSWTPRGTVGMAAKLTPHTCVVCDLQYSLHVINTHTSR